MYEKVKQCCKFREKLLKSGNKILVYNVESDSVYEAGDDNCGRNEMGKIFMRVRDHLELEHAGNIQNDKHHVVPSDHHSYADVICVKVTSSFNSVTKQSSSVSNDTLGRSFSSHASVADIQTLQSNSFAKHLNSATTADIQSTWGSSHVEHLNGASAADYSLHRVAVTQSILMVLVQQITVYTE